MSERIDIPNFKLQDEIGRGGMARVYLAEQQAPRRRVAVKIVSPQTGDDPSFLQALKQEGDTVAQFSHENIVTVYACGVVDSQYYLAMEILGGGDLAQRIRQGLTAEEALKILSQMAGALEHAHAANTLHRDIKPENILFHDNGKAVLVDFGIAKDVDTESNFTKAGAVVGTPHYMAPERAQGKTVDARSDIYALGVVFYEMLTGEKMYKGGDTFAISYAHVYEPIPELPASQARFQQLLNQMVAKDPDERFQSAGALREKIDSLRTVVAHAPGPATDATIVVPSSENHVATQPRQKQGPSLTGASSPLKSPLVMGGIAVAIVAGLIAAVLIARNPGPVATVAAREIPIETRKKISRLLAAADSMSKIKNYQQAEDNYAKVLTEYDCANDEARRGLEAHNPERAAKVIAACQ